jgi:hypothetical protein
MDRGRLYTGKSGQLAVMAEYVFAVRTADRWGEFVVIDRPTLEGLHRQAGLGRRTVRDVIFTLHYGADGVRCKELDLTRFRSAWTAWPALVHASP